jgi:hypothetical protein
MPENQEIFDCIGKVWLWNGEKGSWHFFTIAEEIANEIYFTTSLKTLGLKRGFGAVKVRAIVGDTIFTTSIFPNSKDKTYILPIKASVRKAENIKAGDEIAVRIGLI